MKLYIPHLGDQLRLTSDWAFALHREWRNETMFSHLGLKYDGEGFVLARLPKDTILKVDRIYIRKGASDFDSVTFMIPGQKIKGETTTGTYKVVGDPTVYTYERKTPTKPVRFWVKLDHANEIEFESLHDDT